MRVIAGQYRGIPLQAVPGKTTRPTTDKVKEALFSMIGPFFDGGTCLDLYAGTGALGIEAISRGVHTAIFIDIDAKAIATIKHNVHKLKVNDQAEIYKNDAERALSALAQRAIRFDLVFIDPPYAKQKNERILRTLCSNFLLVENGIVVVEHDCSLAVDSPHEELIKWKQKQFGDTALTVFRYKENNKKREVM